MPKCFGGTCYGCLIDSDCTTSSGKIDTPVCQNNVCSGCSSDSQCSGSTPYCSYNGSCVSCKSNADCKESTRPICSSGGICSTCSKFNTCPNSLKCVPTGACVASVHQCTVSSDCSGNTPICMNRVCVGCTKIGTTTNTCAGLVNKYCISTGQCGQCTNLPNAPNTGCKPTSTTPICNSNYVCSACSSDNDCKRVVGAAGTYCATSGINSGKCVACTSSSQCANSSPICSASLNICLKCFADSDCISRSASLKKCISGSCQGCLNNSDCTPTSLGTTATSTTPICDTVSASIPTCRACSLDSDCSGFKNMPYCNAGTGQCVACNTNTNAGCSGATPICDSITYTCRSCTPNDCTTYDFTVCATQGSNQGTCVECETSSDCSPTSNKPICIANKCVACTQDTDCTSHSISSGSQALKYCTTFAGSSKGSCVQCFASTQCHSDSPQTPICNANQCFSCSQTNPCPDYAPNCYTSLDDSNLQGSCFQCATSSECFTNTGLTTSKTPICSATGTCIGCNSTNDCSVISLASSCKVIDTNTTGPQCVQCNYDNDCSSSLYSISTAPFCFNNTCVNSTTAAIPYAVNMQFKLAWKPTYADTTSDDYKALVANYIAFVNIIYKIMYD